MNRIGEATGGNICDFRLCCTLSTLCRTAYIYSVAWSVIVDYRQCSDDQCTLYRLKIFDYRY